MDQAKSAAWKAVAALAVLFLLGTALLLGFARTTPEQENTRAAQAAGAGVRSGQSGSKNTHDASGAAATAASGAAGEAGTGAAARPANSSQPSTGQGQVQAGSEEGALTGGTSVSEENKGAAPIHPAFDVKTGAELYAAACQSCHMPGGTGAKGGAGTKNYPALAGNQNLQTPAYPATFILNGMGAMPSFADQLTDEQIAMLINYLRHDLNNFEGDTAASDVEPMRKSARSTKLGDDAG